MVNVKVVNLVPQTIKQLASSIKFDITLATSGGTYRIQGSPQGPRPSIPAEVVVKGAVAAGGCRL